MATTPGTLYVGTSGFAYPAWAPAFYPAGIRSDRMLELYAQRLSACELNNTFYRHPTEDRIRAWLDATPSSFRFAVKAQRGGSLRAFGSDPAGTLPWLTRPYGAFGDRLGAVLFRVPRDVKRNDDRLHALLTAWPRELPLVVELEHESWLDDEVLVLLRGHSAVLSATERQEDETPPRLFLTGDFLYLRLRRDTYGEDELEAWAARIVPFLESGHNVYAFLKHDELGAAPGLALTLADRVRTRSPASTAT